MIPAPAALSGAPSADRPMRAQSPPAPAPAAAPAAPPARRPGSLGAPPAARCQGWARLCECACECVRMALVVSGPFELACLWHFMTLKCYVKQIPLANNELAVFSATLSAIEKAVLKTLESLGFDRRDSVAAVTYVTAQHKGRSLSADDLWR